jgi:uncharacterized protein
MARVAALQPSSWERFAPPVYLALLALAELLTAYAPPAVGLTLHAALLLGLLAHVGLITDPAMRALLLTLCMAPLIRLLSLSLPLARLPQIAWYLVVSVPLFLACGLLIRTLGYSRADLSLRLGRPGLQLAIMLFGLVLGVVEYLILRPSPLVAALSWQQLVLPALILLICTGFSEELIFRGVMQRAAYTAMGRWAIVYVAAVFAVLHMGYRSFTDVLFVFAVGVLFGWLVARSGSLLGVTLAHGLTNIVLFLIMPFVGLPTLRPLAWAAPPWAAQLALVGLWAALLVALGLVIRDRLVRRRRTAAQHGDYEWARQIGSLVADPALDSSAIERLARGVWQQLAPDYVLIIDGDRAHAESVISMAIGASGRRLHGLEGLSTPWETFAYMVAGDQTSGLRETRTHPFSRHTGNYLILPLAASRRWLLVRAASGREIAARSALAAL